MNQIFCPNHHLVLDAPRCVQCGWIRPPRPQAGQMAWEQPGLPGLTGFPPGAPAGINALEGVLGVPLPGKIVGLGLTDGQVRWSTSLPGSFRLRSLVPFGKRWLAAVDQEESNLLEVSRPAWLASIDPRTGQIETAWESSGAWINPPVPIGENVFLTTANHRLLVFSQADFSSPRAEVELQGAWRHPPAAGQGVVLVGDGRAMKGEGFVLVAFAQDSLSEQWRVPLESMLTHTPALLPGLLVQRGERGAILGRQLSSGQEIWQFDASKIYGPILTANGRVYFAARGSRDPAAADHYRLVILDGDSGKLLHSASLPGRVQRITTADDPHLLLSTDQGHLLCFDLDGRPLWSLQPGSNEDPFRTELLAAEGLAVLGTYAGRVIAVKISGEPDKPGDPAALLQDGKASEAAQVLALRGDLAGAARLFAEELKEPARALALYERAGLWPDAGRMAMDLKRFDLARGFFARAGDARGEAAALERLGDHIAASQAWERAGDFVRAGANYEAAGEPVKAWEMYHRAGDRESVRRLRASLPADLRTIELLEQKELFEEAGEVSERAGLLDRAAKLYERAGEAQRFQAVLVRMLNEHPAEWALRRLIELVRSQGNFQLETAAWERLAACGQVDAAAGAASACLRAARQAEARGETPEAAAKWFEKAMGWYEQDYNDEERDTCWDKILRLRQLPRITLQGRAEKVFREGEQNRLFLTLENTGYGVALRIQIEVVAGSFIVNERLSELFAEHLQTGKRKDLVISLSPQEGVFGEVGLSLSWRWGSRASTQEYKDSRAIWVNVKRLSESSGTATPVHFTNYGTVIQTDGGGFEMIGGDKVGRDKIAGDQILGDRFDGDKVESGGQKGDRVEIQRGKSPRPIAGEGFPEQPNQPRCSVCDLPLEPGSSYCAGCGMKLS